METTRITPSVRSRWLAAVVALVCLYLSWQIFDWIPGDRQLIGDLLPMPLWAGTMLAAWRTSLRCASGSRVRTAWRLVAAAILVGTLGDCTKLVYEVGLGQPPYPSPADALYLAFYPLMLLAILRFPSAPLSRPRFVQMALDAATTALGGGALILYFVLGPTAAATSGSRLQDAFSIAYPAADLVLLVAIASVLLRTTLPGSRASLRAIVAGICLYVVGDVVYGYVTLHGGYAGGDWLDTTYVVAFALFAWSTTLERSPRAAAPEPGPSEATEVRERSSWLPYLAVAVCFGVVVFAERHEHFFPRLSLILWAVAVVVLVSVRQLCAQRALVIAQHELRSAHDQLRELATTDALTGAPNHRALVAAIDHEVARVEREGSSFGLLFIDVDRFKAINDELGHEAGDAVLCELASLVNTELRMVDVVGRWGGEEFIAVLPGTDRNEAVGVAERVRASIATHSFLGIDPRRVTCSIGVAAYPADGASRAELVAQADRAMYAAKRFGRNQAIAAGDDALALIGPLGGEAVHADDAAIGAVAALAAMVDARDRDTADHSADVALLAQQMALALGIDADEAREIGIAGRLHDVGKVGIPDAILHKPGPLTDSEWELMKTHPAAGADIVARIPALRSVTTIIRSHHERWDGSGYPDGLVGEHIPTGARLIAVADAYNAMVSNRPYRGPMSPSEAMAELRRCAGTQFHEAAVETLGEIVGIPAARDYTALVTAAQV